jgi:NAD+ kinase
MKKRESSKEIRASNILIIYKYFSKEALECAKNVLEYLIEIKVVTTIYTEESDNFSEIAKKYNTHFIQKKQINEISSSQKIELIEKNESPIRLKIFEREDCNDVELVIIIGGDGTVLWGNHLFTGHKKPPFLTFNLGTLGYLTYFKCSDYKLVIDELLLKQERLIEYEKRSTLDVSFITKDEKLKNTTLNCLNEVIFDKGSGIQMIKTHIYVNNEKLNVIRSDGVIASTSTGSTAYNLSCGGPISHYELDVMILNAICPFTLSFRPIIFARDITIKVILDEQSAPGRVGNDCVNSYNVNPGEGIEIKVSDYDLRIIILDSILESPLSNWKNKMVNQLGWSNAFKNV